MYLAGSNLQSHIIVSPVAKLLKHCIGSLIIMYCILFEMHFTPSAPKRHILILYRRMMMTNAIMIDTLLSVINNNVLDSFEWQWINQVGTLVFRKHEFPNKNDIPHSAIIEKSLIEICHMSNIVNNIVSFCYTINAITVVHDSDASCQWQNVLLVWVENASVSIISHTEWIPIIIYAERRRNLIII